MPLVVIINVALREQNCQKIGSERVKCIKLSVMLINSEYWWYFGILLRIEDCIPVYSFLVCAIYI